MLRAGQNDCSDNTDTYWVLGNPSSLMNQTATGRRWWLPLTDWSLKSIWDTLHTLQFMLKWFVMLALTPDRNTIWPAVWWPDSADGGCAGAAAGLLSAAWGAAAGLRTSDASTGPPCSEVCEWPVGSPIASHDGHIRYFTNYFQSTVCSTRLFGFFKI